MSIVSDSDIQAAAAEAGKGLATEKDAVPALPPPAPPSKHIDHASMRKQEAQVQIQAYDLGIITVQSELDGAEKELQSIIDKANAERDRIIEKAEREFATKQIELNRRLDDYHLAKEMLTGQLVVYERRQQEREDAARKAAFKQEIADEADTQSDPAAAGGEAGADQSSDA